MNDFNRNKYNIKKNSPSTVNDVRRCISNIKEENYLYNILHGYKKVSGTTLRYIKQLLLDNEKLISNPKFAERTSNNSFDYYFGDQKFLRYRLTYKYENRGIYNAVRSKSLEKLKNPIPINNKSDTLNNNQLPHFENFISWLKNNIDPNIIQSNDTDFKDGVTIALYIDTTGKIKYVDFLTSIDRYAKNEINKVLINMPNWEPRIVNKLKFPTPYFIGAFGLNCFTSAHKYWKLTLT